MRIGLDFIQMYYTFIECDVVVIVAALNSDEKNLQNNWTICRDVAIQLTFWGIWRMEHLSHVGE